ncbi:hypothetical protein OFC49_37815, partial [Escherichia coli]|nr:hypothetical protein [Escherichia coli]
IGKKMTRAQVRVYKHLTVLSGEALRLMNVNLRHIGELQENNDFTWHVKSYKTYHAAPPSLLKTICTHGRIQGILKWLRPITVQ